jgi:hypothetical protein
MKLMGIISVGFNLTEKLPITFFAFFRYWIKYAVLMRQYVSYSYALREPEIHLGCKYSRILVYP